MFAWVWMSMKIVCNLFSLRTCTFLHVEILGVHGHYSKRIVVCMTAILNTCKLNDYVIYLWAMAQYKYRPYVSFIRILLIFWSKWTFFRQIFKKTFSKQSLHCRLVTWSTRFSGVAKEEKCVGVSYVSRPIKYLWAVYSSVCRLWNFL